MQHPNARNHLIVSLIKSSLRIAGSIFALLAYANPQAAVMIIAATYGLAEIVGIYEELV